MKYVLLVIVLALLVACSPAKQESGQSTEYIAPDSPVLDAPAPVAPKAPDTSVTKDIEKFKELDNRLIEISNIWSSKTDLVVGGVNVPLQDFVSLHNEFSTKLSLMKSLKDKLFSYMLENDVLLEELNINKLEIENYMSSSIQEKDDIKLVLDQDLQDLRQI